jgi:long-chain fatty acid transport protein
MAICFFIGRQRQEQMERSEIGRLLCVRATRSHTPVPSQNFTPAIPDANWNIFAVGAGFLCKDEGRFLALMTCGSSSSRIKAIGLDFTHEADPFEIRVINDNVNPSVNGTYKTTLHIGSVNVKLMF